MFLFLINKIVRLAHTLSQDGKHYALLVYQGFQEQKRHGTVI